MNIDTKRLRELMEKATPGPWTGDRIDGTVKYNMHGQDGSLVINGDLWHEDHELIMALRNELPAILARLEKLEAVAEAARTYVNRKGAMDDIGYHNGGYLLMQAIANLEKP
jgi:hypothetical protein